MDNDLKRDIILDNYSNPSNRGRVDNKDYIYVNTNNSSCIDNIDLYILIEDDVIKDIKFEGEACAISTSSTSIMTKELIGKNTKRIILAHLSEINNTPEIAYKTVKTIINQDIMIDIALQNESLDIGEI